MANITDNLEGYWKMDEVSGTRVDATANDNDLADNNTVGSATGIINLGADFESDNSEYLSITDATQVGLDITGDFSASYWLKVEEAPATNNADVILGKWDSGGVNERAFYTIYRDTGGTKYLGMALSSDGTGGNSDTVLVAQTLTPGTLYHVVITFDVSSGTMEAFVDGSSIGTDTTAIGSIFDTPAPFTIGAAGNPSNYFDGIIDEVGVWSRILTDDEVEDLYNGGSGLAYPFTVAATFVPTVMLI